MRRQEDGSLENPGLPLTYSPIHLARARAISRQGRRLVCWLAAAGRWQAQRLQRAPLVLETMPIAERNRLLDIGPWTRAAAAAAWVWRRNCSICRPACNRPLGHQFQRQ